MEKAENDPYSTAIIQKNQDKYQAFVKTFCSVKNHLHKRSGY